MKGSKIKNIRFDPNKQKIVACEVCNREIIVGKFAKKDQKCENCINLSKKKNVKKVEEEVKKPVKLSTFSSRFYELVTKLGFEVTDKRIWRKKYPIDGGGIVSIHPMIEHGVAGEEPKLAYFSLIIQRAVGLNDNFRKIMPPDAASDCEILADEFDTISRPKHKIGQEQCAMCGAITDEFAVDTKNARILCIKPNNCFRKFMSGGGAESLA